MSANNKMAGRSGVNVFRFMRFIRCGRSLVFLRFLVTESAYIRNLRNLTHVRLPVRQVRDKFWAFIVSVFLTTFLAIPAFAQMSWIQAKLTGDPVWTVNCNGCIWNKTFHTETTIEQPWTVSSVVWSSDGRYISVGSAGEGIINVYDTDSWKLISSISRWDSGGFQPLTRFTDQNANLILPRIWGSNTKIMAPTIDDNVSLEKWDIKQNIIAKKYYVHFEDEKNHPFDWIRAASIAQAVAVSQDGKLIAATVGGGGSRVLIYDSDTAKIIQNIVCQRNNIPKALAFSPDGLEIAVGGCLLYKVSVYSVETGKPNFQTDVDPGSDLDNAISYNPKGTLIAVGSSRGDFGKVTILNASGGSVLETLPDGPSDRSIQLGEHAEITNLQWISNNLILTSYDASNPDGGIARIWDTTSLKIIGELQGNDLQLVSISPDGSRLAAVFGKKVVIGILH